MKRRSKRLAAAATHFATVIATLTAAGARAQVDIATPPASTPSAGNRDPHAYSDGVDFSRGRGALRLGDEHRFHAVHIDELETARADGESVVPFDIEAWIGRTYDRLVFKAEGEIGDGDLDEGRAEAAWAHAVAPYWDLQLGLRRDSGRGPGRNWLAAGIAGLAPYWFDLELTAYFGEASRTALRLDAAYEMLITQRLVLEPRLEANFFGQADPARGLGSGLAELSLGLRLRYEVRRELAPYVGIEWSDERGGTEMLTRAAGRDPSDTRAVLGLKFWF